ncbi:unnamed protein product, partial [Allacma fusca]
TEYQYLHFWSNFTPEHSKSFIGASYNREAAVIFNPGPSTSPDSV